MGSKGVNNLGRFAMIGTASEIPRAVPLPQIRIGDFFVEAQDQVRGLRVAGELLGFPAM